jgi:hypothetical protein
MQSFIQSGLTRSALLGVLMGTSFVGFGGLGGKAIASQPQIANPSDTIKSDHWAFQSLKSLVERYRCVPSSTYQQLSATHSRYAMAAILNGCLDQIADRFTTPEDRIAFQTLRKEFEKEIDALRERVRKLEARTGPYIPKLAITDSQSDSPFPDLQPTHWAFQSAQSLSQRYRCVPSTPNVFSDKKGTTSRYEMAVFLNTCLNRIGDRFANQKDLETAQALQKEFKPELTALEDRVGFLENRAATFDSQKFSPTTKLQGQAVITFQGGGFR